MRKNGRMEGWKDGRMEEMEDWRDGRLGNTGRATVGPDLRAGRREGSHREMRLRGGPLPSKSKTAFNVSMGIWKASFFHPSTLPTPHPSISSNVRWPKSLIFIMLLTVLRVLCASVVKFPPLRD